MKVSVFTLSLLLLIISCKRDKEPIPEGEVLAESGGNFNCEGDRKTDLNQTKIEIIGTWELKAAIGGWSGPQRTVPIEKLVITDTYITYLRYKKDDITAPYEIISKTSNDDDNTFVLKLSSNIEPNLTVCKDIMIIDYCQACDGVAFYYRRVK